MRYFNFLKNKIHLSFAADDVGRLGLIYIGKENKKLKSNKRLFQRLCKPPNGYIIKIQVWRF